MKYSHYLSIGVGTTVAILANAFSFSPTVIAVSGLVGGAVAQASAMYIKRQASNQIEKRSLQLVDIFLETTDMTLINRLKKSLNSQQTQVLKECLKKIITETIESLDSGKKYESSEILKLASATILETVSLQFPEYVSAGNVQDHINTVSDVYQKGGDAYQKGAGLYSAFTSTRETQSSLVDLATVENAQAVVEMASAATQAAGQAYSWASKVWNG